MSSDISNEKKLEILKNLLVSAKEQKYSIIINGQIANEIGNQKAVDQHQKMATEAQQSIVILERKIKEMEEIIKTENKDGSG